MLVFRKSYCGLMSVWGKKGMIGCVEFKSFLGNPIAVDVFLGQTGNDS